MVISYEIIYCERSKKYIANLQGFGIMDVYIHVDGVIKADVFSMFGSGQYMYKKRMDKTKCGAFTQSNTSQKYKTRQHSS